MQFLKHLKNLGTEQAVYFDSVYEDFHKKIEVKIILPLLIKIVFNIFHFCLLISGSMISWTFK